MCVDGVFSTIGSFNFDLYSARRNLEVGVAVFDRNFALKMQEQCEHCVCLAQGARKCVFFVTLETILKQKPQMHQKGTSLTQKEPHRAVVKRQHVDRTMCFFTLIWQKAKVSQSHSWGLQKFTCHTSSTAQGGGGSFKDWKPVGEVSCCDSWVQNESLSLYLLLCVCVSLSIYISICLPTYVPIYLSFFLSIYLRFIACVFCVCIACATDHPNAFLSRGMAAYFDIYKHNQNLIIIVGNKVPSKVWNMRETPSSGSFSLQCLARLFFTTGFHLSYTQ